MGWAIFHFLLSIRFIFYVSRNTRLERDIIFSFKMLGKKIPDFLNSIFHFSLKDFPVNVITWETNIFLWIIFHLLLKNWTFLLFRILRAELVRTFIKYVYSVKAFIYKLSCKKVCSSIVKLCIQNQNHSQRDYNRISSFKGKIVFYWIAHFKIFTNLQTKSFALRKKFKFKMMFEMSIKF